MDMAQSRLFEKILREATFSDIVHLGLQRIKQNSYRDSYSNRTVFDHTRLVSALKQLVGYAPNLGVAKKGDITTKGKAVEDGIVNDGTLSHFFKNGANAIDAILGALAVRCQDTPAFVKFLNAYGREISASYNPKVMAKVIDEAARTLKPISQIQKENS